MSKKRKEEQEAQPVKIEDMNAVISNIANMPYVKRKKKKRVPGKKEDGK